MNARLLVILIGGVALYHIHRKGIEAQRKFDEAVNRYVRSGG